MKSEPKAFASLSSGLLARKGAARPAMRPQGFGQGGSGLDDLGWNDMGYDSPKPTLVPVEEGDVPQISRSPLLGLTPASPVHDQQAEIEHRFTSGYDEDEEEEGGEEQVFGSYASVAADSYDEGDEEDFEETSSVNSFATLTANLAPVMREIQDEEPLELAEEFAVEDEQPLVPEAATTVAVVDPHASLVPFNGFNTVVEPELEPEAEYQAQAEPVIAPVAAAPAASPTRQVSVSAEPSAKGKAAFTLRLDPSRHLKLRLACAVTGRSAQQLVTRALDELLASMPELEAMAERAPAERISRKG